MRNELDAAAPDTKDGLPADTAGVVSPDHSQADPEPEASDVLPRDHAPVAPD